MSANLDLFTPGGVGDAPQRNSEVYRVSYKSSKSGKYTAVVRFIPFYKDPARNIRMKFTSYVVNPISNRGMYVDDPKTVGKNSPVSDMYWRMQNTQVKAYMDFSKANLGTKQQYASLVQILRDDIHPELVGQIKVFIYGKKIFDKLHYEECPEGGQAGINPFDPFKGRKFSIVCENVSNYNNFDNSSFYDEKDPTGTQILPSGIWYMNPETGNMEIAVEGMPDKNKQYLADYLAANSPDLSAYDFQEWTKEQADHVNEVLSIATSYISTGRLDSPQQIAATAAYQGIYGAPQTATPAPPAPSPMNPVVFPGATAPASVTATPIQPQAAAPVAVPQAPVVPQAPIATAPVQPTGFAPVASPQQPTGFAPVAAPIVAPQGAPAAPAHASTGMNVDDILSQL